VDAGENNDELAWWEGRRRLTRVLRLEWDNDGAEKRKKRQAEGSLDHVPASFKRVNIYPLVMSSGTGKM